MSLAILFHFLCLVLSAQAEACNTGTTQNQPHQISNTQRTENKATDVVIQQHSRKLLTMDILMSETCWAHKTWNKITSDIKLVFHSSTITMMHGPINIRFLKLCNLSLKPHFISRKRNKSIRTDNYKCISESIYLMSITFWAVSTWSDNTAHLVNCLTIFNLNVFC